VRVNGEQRHMQAMMAPNSTEERAITNIVNGLDAYVRLLREQKKRMAPELHAQLSAAVVNVTRAALSLTNGPLGRLDSALLRRKMGEMAGIDLDSATVVRLHEPKNDLGRTIAIQHPVEYRETMEVAEVSAQESAFHA